MPAAELYAKLGVTETGKQGNFLQFRMHGEALPNNWHVVAVKRCDDLILSHGVLSQLSSGCSIIACSIEEHVNYASSGFWRDGREIWNVAHQGDRDVTDLNVRGSPPEPFDDLRARAFARQEAEGDRARVDYIASIPRDLADGIIASAFDENDPGRGAIHTEPDPVVFRELCELPTGLLAGARKRWWKFWQR